MRRFLIILTFSMLPVAAGAQTLSVKDVVELTKAGLGDEALLALIEVHRPIFPVDLVTIKGLKDAGVSPVVITAMIRSGRTPPPPVMPVADPVELPAPLPPAPQVVVIEHHDEPAVREVAVPVPVYVAVGRLRRDRHDDEIGSPLRGSVHRPSKPVEPVFWGWGGKLRPDAWQPTAADVQKDAKVPREPQRK